MKGCGGRTPAGEQARYEKLAAFARDVASDGRIAHEAVVAHFLAEKRGVRVENSRAFLVAATRHLARSGIRGERRERVPLDALREAPALAPPIDTAAIRVWVQRAPPQLAAWLTDCLVGLSDRELAHRHGVSLRAIRKRHQRVAEWLQRNYFEIPGSGRCVPDT